MRRILCPSVVGRDDELASLSAGLDDLQDGRGGCVLLVGEPGIGKSRLARAAAAEAQRRGVTVLFGRASPTGGSVPYQCLTSALLHGLRSSPPVEASDLQPLRAGLATLLPGFVEGPAVEPSPVLLGETVLRLAALLGGEDGAVVVLEDLHWACAESLAVTEYLADNASSERVLVLGTSRPEGEAPAVIDALDRRGSASVSRLAPLGPEDVSEMATACLAAGGTPPAGVFELLHARAGGLPFLVEELLAGLVTGGSLVAEPSGWQLSDSRADVPLSFAQSVGERLAGLSARDRRVVDLAALLGRDFDWSHLPRTVEATDAEVLESLSRAVELQLVDETGGGRFQFRHALTVVRLLLARAAHASLDLDAARHLCEEALALDPPDRPARVAGAGRASGTDGALDAAGQGRGQVERGPLPPTGAAQAVVLGYRALAWI